MERSSEELPERFSLLEQNYSRITERISEAAARSGRTPGDVELVAVTKTVPVELINHAIALGVTHIGENRVQELESKLPALDTPDGGLKISVIGHLQTNKAKKAVEMAGMIQSVDSLHLARELSKRSVELGKTTECLIEINIGDEASKSGVGFDGAEELVCAVSELEALAVRGLMTIPPVDADPANTRRFFAKIHKLFIDIGTKNLHNKNIEMKYLSMGMSADYAEAIEDGSNMVRIGSALFGARNY